MTSHVKELSYGSRNEYIRGIDSMLARPLLTMEQEMLRDFTWTDWKGVTYDTRTQWAYVKGPAVSKPNCTPGHRDETNDGMMPSDFLERINGFIEKRRKEGHGCSLPPRFAFLTENEVLATRLYTCAPSLARPIPWCPPVLVPRSRPCFRAPAFPWVLSRPPLSVHHGRFSPRGCQAGPCPPAHRVSQLHRVCQTRNP